MRLALRTMGAIIVCLVVGPCLAKTGDEISSLSIVDALYLAPKLSRPDSGSRSLPVNLWDMFLTRIDAATGLDSGHIMR